MKNYVILGSQTSGCYLIKALAFSILFQGALSINQEDIAEPCPPTGVSQDPNDSWDNAAPFLEDVPYYIPFASKYNAFLMTQNVYHTKDFEYLTESHLEHSCFTMNKLDGWGLVNVTGYDDRYVRVVLIPTEVPKVFRFFLPYPDGGIVGYASIVLSDNETYNVFDYCFNNGLRSFAVVSTSSTLDEAQLTTIKTHVKSLGYQEKNFIHLKYSHCFDSDGNLAPTTGDFPKPAQPSLR